MDAIESVLRPDREVVCVNLILVNIGIRSDCELEKELKITVRCHTHECLVRNDIATTKE